MNSTAEGASTECLFVKNLQGDVERVISATGTLLASYTYDAWGCICQSSGSLADINPIRYRSYYYDRETGLYYLQSRYYASQVGRFVNADGLGAIDGPLPIADVAVLLAIAAMYSSQLHTTSRPVPTTQNSKYESNYWAAEIIDKRLVIGEPLDLAQASLRVSMQGSVMCKDQESAIVHLRVNNYRNAVGPKIHGKNGFFQHYHPTRNHTGYGSVHIWFYR